MNKRQEKKAFKKVYAFTSYKLWQGDGTPAITPSLERLMGAWLQIQMEPFEPLIRQAITEEMLNYEDSISKET